MGLRVKLAVWVVVAAFAAAPALAVASAGCVSCCCPPTPCHQSEGDCGSMLSSASCCSEAPAAVPSVVKQTPEVPNLQAPPSDRALPPEAAARIRPPEPSTVLAALASLLRLSVVLTL